MSAKCFQAALDRSQVSATTTGPGSLLYLVASLAAAVAADGSDDVLPNPYSEIKRRILAASGGKRCEAYRDMEVVLTSLETKANQ